MIGPYFNQWYTEVNEATRQCRDNYMLNMMILIKEPIFRQDTMCTMPFFSFYLFFVVPFLLLHFLFFLLSSCIFLSLSRPCALDCNWYALGRVFLEQHTHLLAYSMGFGGRGIPKSVLFKRNRGTLGRLPPSKTVIFAIFVWATLLPRAFLEVLLGKSVIHSNSFQLTESIWESMW